MQAVKSNSWKEKTTRRTITAALLGLASLVSGIGRRVETGQALGSVERRYLLLVTFYGSESPDRLARFDGTPYDGVAVRLVDADNTGTPPSFRQIQAMFAKLRQQTSKDLWPWVSINRMIGTEGSNPQADKPEFRRFKGLDLDGSSGTQREFLHLWRTALREARTTRVPGVVLDMEFYNDYAAYSIVNVARERRLSVDEVERQLHHFGDRMARIAGEEYSDAEIWTLNAGFSSPNDSRSVTGNQSTRDYLLRGLLDGARNRHLGLVLVDSGETSLGYCHPSANALHEAIRSRLKQYAPLLRAYRGSLQLGGTIALWRDAQSRLGWLREGDCAFTDVQKPEDFSTYLTLLFSNYRYVWVYAPVVGRYDPFDPLSSARIDAVLKQAKLSVQ
jgi:hypothetical protein